MTRFYADVDNRRAVERLDAISPALRAVLLDVTGVWKDKFLAAARARAPVKTGAYLASITGVVYGSKLGVIGTVKAGSNDAWYAHILEYGATLPAHIIADAAGIMHFTGSAGEVFAKAVNFPGAVVPERDILTGPFKAARGQLESSIAQAADKALVEA